MLSVPIPYLLIAIHALLRAPFSWALRIHSIPYTHTGVLRVAPYIYRYTHPLGGHIHTQILDIPEYPILGYFGHLPITGSLRGLMEHFEGLI